MRAEEVLFEFCVCGGNGHLATKKEARNQVRKKGRIE